MAISISQNIILSKFHQLPKYLYHMLEVENTPAVISASYAELISFVRTLQLSDALRTYILMSIHSII